MKQVFILLLLVIPVSLLAGPPPQDSLPPIKDTINIVDSSVTATDTINLIKDSLKTKADSLILKEAASSYHTILQSSLMESRFLNVSGIPVVTISRNRPVPMVNGMFYLMLGMLILLASLRFFYTRYFNNLFRVFFNTSLRQGQLTDQLLQAKQASLFFNILFAVTGGLYIFLLLTHVKKISYDNPFLLVGACVISVAVIYFFKYITLKFTGWLTGYREAANTYLFIIFLINKILSVLLIPFLVVISFSDPVLQYPAVLVSLLLIGLMFLLRFLRSWGLLQNQVKVGRGHFFLYIAGIELLPLLLIYKAVMVFIK